VWYGYTMNTSKTLEANEGMVRLFVDSLLSGACPRESKNVGATIVAEFLIETHCVTWTVTAWKPLDGTDSSWRVIHFATIEPLADWERELLSDPHGTVTP